MQIAVNGVEAVRVQVLPEFCESKVLNHRSNTDCLGSTANTFFAFQVGTMVELVGG